MVSAPTTGPPATTTGVADDGTVDSVRGESAMLGAVVTAHDLPLSYQFQYGPTVLYGMLSRAQLLAASSTSNPVQAAIRHLVPGVLYHYRLTVTSSDLTVSYGADHTFRTPRVKPRRVRNHITAYWDHGAPYRYRLHGWLVLPRGLSRRTACRTPGYTTVAVIHGNTTMVTRRVKLTVRCTYNTSFSFVAHSLSGSGRLYVHMRFTGNQQLRPRSARTLKVRYGPGRRG